MKRFLIFVSACMLAMPGVLYAEVIFLGPTPYLSLADSPFDRSGLGSTFFLEDFEDGTIDFPVGVEAWPGFIREPSDVTDSVDGDDGLIDGNGSAGHSFVPTVVGAAFSFPPRFATDFQLNFDAGNLGGFPNFVGLVVTDAKPNSGLSSFSSLTFSIVDGFGRSAHQVFETAMDDSSNGGASEDRFYGVMAPMGIKNFTVTSGYTALFFDEYRYEVDHVQFGFGVPEPSLGTFFHVLAGILVCQWSLHRR